MKNRLKDRMNCLSCGKEILNPDRALIQQCPHCGDRIEFAYTRWMEKEDVDELAAMGLQAFFTEQPATKRSRLRALFGKK